MDTRAKGILLTVLSALLFGVTPVLASRTYELGSNAITTTFYREVLGLDAEETPISYMVADSKMELMNEGGRGRLGHIGFYTPDIQAAMAYLEEKGYAMDPSTARYEADGKTLMLIYLKEEMNGFAIHLTTRK